MKIDFWYMYVICYAAKIVQDLPFIYIFELRHSDTCHNELIDMLLKGNLEVKLYSS